MKNFWKSKPHTLICADSLAGKLKTIIEKLPPDGVTLAEIRDLLGHEGLLLLTAFLSIVFLIPVSPPGVSTVFGAAILMVAVSRLFNCQLWLPKRFLTRPLPAEKLRAGLNKGLIWIQRLEYISRSNRLEYLTASRHLNIFNNCALVLSACLLMAPFGLIPFSNTLPALAILLFTVGLLQRDGLCILFGHIANFATIVYFGLLIAGGGIAFIEILRRITTLSFFVHDFVMV